MAKRRRAGVAMQVFVSEEFRAAFEAMARQDGGSVADEMRLALEKWLADGGRKVKATPKGLPRGRPRKP